MKISVIIVAYKSGSVLKDSLDSLGQYNDLGSDLEVITVDNSPESERVYSSVQDSSCPGVRYIPAENRGFGAGNNTGAKASAGEILCFMNPDILYIEPVFGKIYQKFQEDPNLMLAGGKLLNSDLTPGFSFYYDYSSDLLHRTLDKVQNRRDHFIPEKMYTSGANLFVRREAFFATGMFDENIFMYYEEPDLIRRIRRAVPGARNDFIPDVRMIHLERRSTPKGTDSLKRELDSSIYYGKKYGLDVQKKIRFEWSYLRLKRSLGKLLKKSGDEMHWLDEAICFIEEHYGEYLQAQAGRE